MKVIVGLGNPGKKYDNTRHNIGFEALDYIADKEGISINTGKHKALIGTGYMGGEKVLLVKPQTFMNLSGESLRPIMDFYKLEPEDFIIIHDDIDLDVGRLRIRRKGSAGGHNGLKSIISHLGSMDFPRVKIGVGEKPKGYDLADYVELDVHLTSNNVVVVMHDSNLKRTTGVNKNIWQVSYDRIKELDAGSWFSADFAGEQVPTLREALELCRGRL